MKPTRSTWICCQLGAREHYAVPRALQLGGVLSELITDLWIQPGTLMNSWPRRLNGRFHPDLADATVKASNLSALAFEATASATGKNGWNLTRRRNEWFQREAVAQLLKGQNGSANGHHRVFAYSYAAEEIFKFARANGWTTVLGQIDPGPADEHIIARLNENNPDGDCEPAPQEYWDRWRNECALADQIVVNSKWSKDSLLSAGVPAEKIQIVPVAYEPSGPHSFQREYQSSFTSERPLRVLFLGKISLRKGVGHLLEAIELLAGGQIEFWFVGPTQMRIPADLKQHPRVKWFGTAPRADVSRFYKDADVLIFPTLSDGFGITQLEAQSWKLPVIASRHCGDVVCHGENGILLEEVSAQTIAEALAKLARSPETLREMSLRSGVDERFSLKALASSLINL